MKDDRPTIKCRYCNKQIHYRVLKKWKKHIIVHSIDLGGTKCKGYVTYLYGLIRINDHDVGFLRIHTCQGSSRKFKKKIGELSGHK